jgi:hypothetical protein
MGKRRLRTRPRRATYLALLGAAVVSIGLTVPFLVTSPAPAAQEAPQPADKLTARASDPDFDAVTGPSCSEDETRRLRVSTAPGAAGWQRGRSEVGPGEGCGDGFLYVDPGYASTNTVEWLFTFSSAATRSCRIDVFVPQSPHASAEVWYDVADRFENVMEGLGAFTVDQYATRGTWVSAASVVVETKTLMIHLEGEGQDLTPDRPGVTAGPIALSCTRSGPHPTR